MTNDNPYGDNAGTRVGHPDAPQRASKQGDGDAGSTESGNEAARGIEEKNKGGRSDRAGSEPLKDRGNEHESGYGGKGGDPKQARTSADTDSTVRSGSFDRIDFGRCSRRQVSITSQRSRAIRSAISTFTPACSGCGS